ncbi:hypothetical protein DCAR_0208394 [Daucus carota subsp. sativus]|uniref:Uncharacterized protein n=1 Tax=Daucus carota subsp. sativus TaxID=79200 RepID=A0AAF1ANF3_DAUCS|nr:hypothetical protein DCAR_0208394 [Daucus carota subsp. sativus]
MKSIPFSAFWLRSSPVTIACYWGLRESPKRCTTALAWLTPPNLIKSSKFLIPMKFKFYRNIMSLSCNLWI